MNSLPFKSVGVALIFSVLLGPIGCLYSSLYGGVVLIFLSFTALSGKYYNAFFIFYLLSCILSVAATNAYNNKLMKGNLNEKENYSP